MTNFTSTRAWRIIRNTVATFLLLAVWYEGMSLTLPEECRDIPVREMSDFCQGLVIP